jgi:hypothetical protein
MNHGVHHPHSLHRSPANSVVVRALACEVGLAAAFPLDPTARPEVFCGAGFQPADRLSSLSSRTKFGGTQTEQPAVTKTYADILGSSGSGKTTLLNLIANPPHCSPVNSVVAQALACEVVLAAAFPLHPTARPEVFCGAGFQPADRLSSLSSRTKFGGTRGRNS